MLEDNKEARTTSSDNIPKRIKIAVLIFLGVVLLCTALIATLRNRKEQKGNEAFYVYLYTVHDAIDSIEFDYEKNLDLLSETRQKYDELVEQVGYVTSQMEEFSFELEFLSMSIASKDQSRINDHKQRVLEFIEKYEKPGLY